MTNIQIQINAIIDQTISFDEKLALLDNLAKTVHGEDLDEIDAAKIFVVEQKQKMLVKKARKFFYKSLAVAGVIAVGAVATVAYLNKKGN